MITATFTLDEMEVKSLIYDYCKKQLNGPFNTTVLDFKIDPSQPGGTKYIIMLEYRKPKE